MKSKVSRPFESLFQSFAGAGGHGRGAERVAALRAELATRGFAGFLVPRADRQQNEYVPAADERLLWLTGFSGSAGLAIILSDRAALFVDGRYTSQAPAQVDTSVFSVLNISETSPAAWIEAHLKSGERLGFDPWLHTPGAIAPWAKACADVGGELAPTPDNPVDAIWPDRPPEPLGAVSSHPERFAGESAANKIERARADIKGADGLLVSDAQNVAWLFNIRGADVAHTPLPLGFAYLPKAGNPTLFVDARKLSNAMREIVSDVADIEEPAWLANFVESLGSAKARVAFDSATAPSLLTRTLAEAGGEPSLGPDPITLMKARKNETELAGSRAAHLRDGVAMARFLAWFDAEAPKGEVTEILAAQALETFRRETGALREISFGTIAAAGPNAAMPHYGVSEASNRPVEKGLFLIDSGGQYKDGTTDITRTIAVGKPGKTMRDRYTRVLKGHIAIARAVFPKGTTGAQIDALARHALWRAGLDFDHGTGHGVGSYLSVHEGPQRIAKTGVTPLAPGMIISNEPGYYAPGRFGVRIENLVVVEPRKINGAEREMLGFETLSLAPIDTRAIELDLLDAEEIAWLDDYHAWVRETLSPHLETKTRAWLKHATRRLKAAKSL